MSRTETSVALRRALQGALSMAQHRGYEVVRNNILLKPPPSSCDSFFRCFPAHFDVTSPLYGETIRFEFWDVPLGKLPGQVGQLVAGRVRRAARAMAVAPSSVRLMLVVPHCTHLQERQERRAVERLGAQMEVFPHHFFSRVHHLCRQPPHRLLKDRLQLEHFRELYGPLANLPKINADDLLCRYLGASPGDVLLSGGVSGTMVSWRLVVPSRRPPHDDPGQLARRVAQQRSDSARFRAYLQTISENPSYY